MNQYDNELTEAQQKFADYYIELNNATQAAIKAGYSEKSAYSQASRLLKNDKVKEYLDHLKAERREFVQNELAKYAKEAVKMLFDLAQNADSENVRAIALKDIMDRSGYKPVEKRENANEMSGKIEFGFVEPHNEP